MRRLDGITDAMDMNLGKLLEMVRDRPGMLQSMGSQRVHDWEIKQQQESSSRGFRFNYHT